MLWALLFCHSANPNSHRTQRQIYTQGARHVLCERDLHFVSESGVTIPHISRCFIAMMRG